MGRFLTYLVAWSFLSGAILNAQYPPDPSAHAPVVISQPWAWGDPANSPVPQEAAYIALFTDRAPREQATSSDEQQTVASPVIASPYESRPAAYHVARPVPMVAYAPWPMAFAPNRPASAWMAVAGSGYQDFGSELGNGSIVPVPMTPTAAPATSSTHAATCVGGCTMGCPIRRGDWSIFGGLLYLRARDAEVAYAVPIDGPIADPPPSSPIQIGGFGIVDPDFDAGFRAGVRLALTSSADLVVQYSLLDSTTASSISTNAPNVIRSLVSHPASASAATDFLNAAADLDIHFEIVDAYYLRSKVCSPWGALSTWIGTRYVNLEQQFAAEFSNNGVEQVQTDIDFDGGGAQLGLQLVRQNCGRLLYGYASAAASFIAGRFQADYFQGQSFDPTVVETDWRAGRIVPILDLELGAGWTSPSGALQLRGGYVVSAWYNVVQTDSFIQAVQRNDLTDLDDTLTFDGLVLRGEWSF